MLSELTELATEASSEKRRQLLGRIADMFYNDGRDLVAEQDAHRAPDQAYGVVHVDSSFCTGGAAAGGPRLRSRRTVGGSVAA